jgi:hypothetical protein
MVFTVFWSIFNSFWAVFFKQIEIWFLIYTLSKVELSSFFCRIQRFWVTRINKFHRFRDVLRLNSPHLDVNTKWRNRTLRSEWLTKWELLRSKIREKGWSQLFFFPASPGLFFSPRSQDSQGSPVEIPRSRGEGLKSWPYIPVYNIRVNKISNKYLLYSTITRYDLYICTTLE